MKLPKLAPISPALLLTACYGLPTPPPAIELSPNVEWGQGIDLATDSGPVLDEVANGGVDFVARYYREPDSRWPALSAGEAQLLSLRGLRIVAVWESHSADPGHFSYASGYGDAITAYGEARGIGQPPGSAIYFAVDFNARGWEIEPIDEYFRGVNAALAAVNGGRPYYTVGVYGSGTVCSEVKGNGLARYSWLSNSIAWHGSGTYADWNILQGEESAELGFNRDSDQARGEYGAFRIADTGFASGGTALRAPAQPRAPAAPARPPSGQALTSANIPAD